MRNINEVLKMNTEKEIIDEIFNQTYKVEVTKHDNFEGRSIRVEGYYISLPRLSRSQISEAHVVFRMFYTLEKLALKIFIGDTNATDIESNKQFARLYLIEVLNKYLDGGYNKDLEEDLKIYGLDNFKNILQNRKLSSNLCNFIIKTTQNKLRDLIRKSNVDAYYEPKSRKFKKNSYVYLDAEVEGKDGDIMNHHEIVVDETAVIEKVVKANLYNYINETYINSNVLLNAQLEFFYDIAENARIDGKLVACDGYSKQQIYQMKKRILKRIEDAIEHDEKIGKIRDKNDKVVKYFLK